MKVQLAFIVDCTQSMADWIDAVKNQISDIIANTQSQHGMGVDFQVAFVGYTDQDENMNTKTHVVSFTRDIQKFKNRVRAIEVRNGHDWCEDMFNGFHEVHQLEWDPNAIRHLVHIADAPPHGVEFHDPWQSDRQPQGDPHGGNLMQLVEDLPEIEQTLMFLHESLAIWSENMRDTFTKCNIINLREILRSEDGNRTDILTPTLSRVIHQSMTPGDPN